MTVATWIPARAATISSARSTCFRTFRFVTRTRIVASAAAASGIVRCAEQRGAGVGDGGIANDCVVPAGRAHPDADGPDEVGGRFERNRGEPEQPAREPLVRQSEPTGEDLRTADDVGPKEARERSPDRPGEVHVACRREHPAGLGRPPRRRRHGRRADDERMQVAQRQTKGLVRAEHRPELGPECVAVVEGDRRELAGTGSAEELDESSPPADGLGGHAEHPLRQELDRTLDLGHEVLVGRRLAPRGVERGLDLVEERIEDRQAQDAEDDAGRMVELQANVGQAGDERHPRGLHGHRVATARLRRRYSVLLCTSSQ